MPYISPEIINKIKRIDLLTYLKNYEPNELVHLSRNTYTTRTHDSLKISNGMWNWFSKGIGGKTALEYLIQVKGYTFIEAVQYLMNLEKIKTPITTYEIIDTKETKLKLPKKNKNNNKVIAYLKSRGINENIITDCIDKNYIYEDEMHNIIFVGYDENNTPKYAGARATNQTRFMHDIIGSNKSYSFKLESENKTNKIHIFEGAIDLLSFASFLLLKNKNYKDYNLISLAGVYQPAKVINQSKIPRAIEKYLIKHKNINEIILHFDNDIAGRNATIAFQTVIPKQYKVVDEPSPVGKDINDYLMEYIRKNKLKNERKI